MQPSAARLIPIGFGTQRERFTLLDIAISIAMSAFLPMIAFDR
jgi:hypothetical protein